jgi:hypothetical protein
MNLQNSYFMPFIFYIGEMSFTAWGRIFSEVVSKWNSEQNIWARRRGRNRMVKLHSEELVYKVQLIIQ